METETDLRAEVRRQVYALAWPAIGHSLLHVGVFFVDRMLLGRYSEDAIAAMQIAGPLNWGFYSLLTSFIVGAVALVARATGAKDGAAVGLHSQVAMLAALVVGLAATSLTGLLPSFLALYESEQVSAAALEGAQAYLETLLWAYPLFCVGLTVSGLMGAAGDTRTPFLVGLLTNALNVGLNALLIYGLMGAPELGVRGAAVATAACWVVECLLLGWAALRGRKALIPGLAGFAAPSWAARRESFGRMMRISLPTLSERLVYHLGYLTFAGFITALGTRAMAAHQACIAIESLSFTTSGAIGVAAAAVVGQQLGAGSRMGARLGAWEAMRLALLILGLAGLGYLAFAGPLVRMFSDEPGVIALASTALLIAALEQPGLAISDVLSQSLRGAGDTRSPLLVTLVSVWVVRVGGCAVAIWVLDWGLAGIWAVTALEWSLRAIVLIAIVRRGRWLDKLG